MKLSTPQLKMNILSVHNNYKIRGGEDESCDSEKLLLRESGHQVEVYEEHNDRIEKLSSLSLAQKTIWSNQTYRKVRRKLRQTPTDVVHVQNFFPLISPSVYYAARSESVPVVQTLRNYRLLCPNALFFRDGRVCEDCLGKPIPYPGIIHNCYRNDKAASMVTTAMITAHRSINTWSKMVDCYIALTNFSRQKLIEGGLPAEKIVVKPNFVHPAPEVGSGRGGYALYVGRLSVEKGLDVLLEAWEKLDSKFPLKIVGDGPLADLVVEATQKNPQIEWLKRRPMKEVHELMGEATFLVFPSKWYETFGRVAVEAFATGTPVVAAKIGAIAELVEDHRTGFHFLPGNAVDLATKVELALKSPQKLKVMRREVRAEFDSKYTASNNYQELMNIYQRVLK